MKKKSIEEIIKSEWLNKLKVKKGEVPNFLVGFDENNEQQASIWSGKTYKVDPRKHVFTTIQERFGNRWLRSLKLEEGAVVVDIGCFIGEKLWQLRDNKNYLGVGVDIAVASVKAAKEMDVDGHKFIAAGMEDLPFKDRLVDLCLVFDVIEHLSKPERGFEEVARILKPGGQLLLHIPIKDNRFSFFWWKQKFFSRAAERDYAEVGHSPERMLNSGEVKNFLKKYGLKVEKEVYYNSFFVHFWDREFFKLLALLSVRLFRQGEHVVGDKRSTHTGGLGGMRSFYGKFVVPVLEVFSSVDWILSKLKVGNTYFILAKKQ